MMMSALWAVVMMMGVTPWRSIHCLEVKEEKRLLVAMTLVPHAGSTGAVCLDGSPPAYHLHGGLGGGARNWLLQFEGGGWCNDVASCAARSKTRRGSTRYMNKLEVFSGILSNDSTANPHDCSYFRGQRIWRAIVLDLLPKGLIQADKVRFLLLFGLSLTFRSQNSLDSPSVDSLNEVKKVLTPMMTLLRSVSSTACIELHQNTILHLELSLRCIPGKLYAEQFHHIFVPPSADPRGRWNRCKLNPLACSPIQTAILQGFRNEMLKALESFEGSQNGGMFLNSCFTHCQSEVQEAWFGDSPRLHNKTIAEAVGDWYFDRGTAKEVDCPYPCDSTCDNLIPSNQGGASNNPLRTCTIGCRLFVMCLLLPLRII
ncbi:Pectinacetylesterase [Musa troglodytarum]|uniref:Pectin acetylesterase n=1 Tax=Musa troglodytarum TaxID=320322 RepID=A0A9E7JE21_9LILI|nr:Pectinacetylesterase [Musa troglodytarum]